MNIENYLDKRKTMISIKRFEMEFVLRPQNLCEHGHGTATLFYLFCKEFGVEINEDILFILMNHDFAETFTGDMNRLIRNKNEKTKEAWSVLEEETLPEELKPWSDKGIENILTEDQLLLFKLSDEMEAYLYCFEEHTLGNRYIYGPIERYAQILSSRIIECEKKFNKGREFWEGRLGIHGLYPTEKPKYEGKPVTPDIREEKSNE